MINDRIRSQTKVKQSTLVQSPIECDNSVALSCVSTYFFSESFSARSIAPSRLGSRQTGNPRTKLELLRGLEKNSWHTPNTRRPRSSGLGDRSGPSHGPRRRTEEKIHGARRPFPNPAKKLAPSRA